MNRTLPSFVTTLGLIGAINCSSSKKSPLSFNLFLLSYHSLFAFALFPEVQYLVEVQWSQTSTKI
jgi:hypothetical protein